MDTLSQGSVGGGVALSLQGRSGAVIQLDSPFYSPCCPDSVDIRLTYHVESIYLIESLRSRLWFTHRASAIDDVDPERHNPYMSMIS